MMNRASDPAALLSLLRNAQATRLLGSVRERLEPHIKRLRTHWEAPVSEEELALRTLLSEFRLLNEVQKERTALSLAELWESFQEQVGGIDSFLNGDEQKRVAYLSQMRDLESRAAAFKVGEAAHYYFAITMMLAYLKSWTDGQRPAEAIDLSRTVTAFIEAGRAGRTGTRQAV